MGLKKILANLAKGNYDGARIDNEENGVSWGFFIDHGTPVKYREGKGSKYFDGRETCKTPGRRTIEKFETPESKELFFKKFGFLQAMFGNHPEVIEYSKDYYKKKKK